MTTAAEIVRAAIPSASDELCEHILWGRTPFPVGRVTARDLYRAASAYRRAGEHRFDLCDWCHRKVAVSRQFRCTHCTP